MNDQTQTLAYARADFEQVNQGFVDRYRASFPKGVGGTMVDLGCGPADIPVRFAHALPGYSITAVDGSEAMVTLAQKAVMAAGDEAVIPGLRSETSVVPAAVPSVTQSSFP